MEEKHFERARVTIGDEMTVTGDVSIDEEGNVTIIVEKGRKEGKEVITHISRCVVKEL